ncbi:MAG: hypothetical protein RL088_215 [Verrucomicrobiota bacterium]
MFNGARPYVYDSLKSHRIEPNSPAPNFDQPNTSEAMHSGNYFPRFQTRGCYPFIQRSFNWILSGAEIKNSTKHGGFFHTAPREKTKR